MEGVVHHGVEDVGLHEVAGVAPQLADDVGVGLHGLHALVEHLPEPERNFVGDVEPHTVAVHVLEPELGGIEQVGHESDVRLGVLHVLDAVLGGVRARQVVVQVRQVTEAPPTVVVVLRLPRSLHVGPARGQGLLELVPIVGRARLALLDGILERPVRIARVVVDDVEDDADAHRVCQLHERLELIVGAEVRIDLAEVGGVVLVRALRFEQRIEVDRGDAEFLQVVELLLHAFDIAAVERHPVAAVRSPRALGERCHVVPVLHQMVVLLVLEIELGPRRWLRLLALVVPLREVLVVGGRAVAEAVRVDLVDDAVLHPVRRLERGEARGREREPRLAGIGRGTGSTKPHRRGAIVQAERVGRLARRHLGGRAPVLVGAIGVDWMHRNDLLPGPEDLVREDHQLNRCDIVQVRLDGELDFATAHRIHFRRVLLEADAGVVDLAIADLDLE